MSLLPDRLETLCTQPSALDPLVEYLRACDYTLPGVARLVGEADIANVIRNAGLCALLWESSLTSDGSPLACLAQLFLLGGRIASRTFRSVFPSRIRDLLEQQGLVRSCDGDLIAGEVSIGEVASTYVLSDKLFENLGEGSIEVNSARDAVWPMCEWSYLLMCALESAPASSSFLDVGCGSGCLSLLVRDKYSRIVGVDINPRAVAFSRLNAGLARAHHLRFEVADCLASTATARHDRVVFAAPGGPTGGEEHAQLVSFGGELGHEVVLRFLGVRSERLLAPTGVCQVFGIFAVEERYESIVELVTAALPQSRLAAVVEPVRSSGLYLSPENIRDGRFPPLTHYGRDPLLLAWLRSRHVKEVVPALVTLRFTGAGAT